MDIELRVIFFVIILFYRLDKKWLNQFEDILADRNGVSLHRAFWKLKKGGYLSGYDSIEFCFDPLFQKVGGLEYILSSGVQFGLIRLDGTSLTYHLDILDERTLEMFIKSEAIPLDILNTAVARLNLSLKAQKDRLNKKLVSPTV